MKKKKSMFGGESYQYYDLLRANKNFDFVKRILDPKNAPRPISDGQIKETHRMAAEYLGKGGTNPAVFPTIVNEGGKLIRLSTEQAMERAIRTGEFIAFDSIQKALDFSKGYKPPEFERYYQHGGE